MEAHEYQKLYQFETDYWWFKGLHGVILDEVKSLGLDKSATLLDAGCGTAQNLVNIENLSYRTFGFDFAVEAIEFWKRRDLNNLCAASINEIPYQSDLFDTVVSVDVFECEGVKEKQAFGELWRVAKPGGYIILIVPAYKWLMSPEHHKAVGANRRYTRRRLRKVLESRPVDIIRISHFFSALFPAIAAYRLTKSIFHVENGAPAQSELKPIDPTLNKLFITIMEKERWILRRMNLPFGSSILAVCQKV